MKTKAHKKHFPLLGYLGTGVLSLACVFLILLIALNGYLLYWYHQDTESLTFVAGYSLVPTLSSSMEDTIYSGDAVLIRESDSDTLGKDQVIVYKTSGKGFSIQRIIDEAFYNGERVFITKGDHNNLENPEPVSVHQIRGSYVTRIPHGAHLLYFLSSAGGTILLIGVPLSLYVIVAVIKNERRPH